MKVKIYRNLPDLVLAGLFTLCLLAGCARTPESARETILFTGDWKFHPGDVSGASAPDFNDGPWRLLDLPHDWSIEGEFSDTNPSGTEGGALPTGIGWYRKTFRLEEASSGKRHYIDFDGIQRSSEVWINGHFLGRRASGYSSFRYDLSPWLYYGDSLNVLAVRADNSLQPASRWYTGSGIYRNVRLVSTGQVHADHRGFFIRASTVEDDHADMDLELNILKHTDGMEVISVSTDIFDPSGEQVAGHVSQYQIEDSLTLIGYSVEVPAPELWSPRSPELYRALIRIFLDGEETDSYETSFGIRYFEFRSDRGFYLNGKHLKIFGVNQHHDLGALGAAVSERAIGRQLEILKDMGCNAIRTAHNLPAPELLDLADRMGFLVMDECFDVWAGRKVRYDGHIEWDEWHKRDLQDMVRRDRNHPSVFMWSIGNEIPEQFDTSGTRIATELVEAVRELDDTRPVTCAMTEQDPKLNHIVQSGALDVLSFNYKHDGYAALPELYSGQKFLASENVSALSTRGHYDMPSDSVRIWPLAYNIPLEGANPDYTASAYDNAHAYWGSTHEACWDVVKNLDFISGMFIWSGFDYLGEPTPYPWPARSSYLGIIDLAGFPKDAYYLYQSEWTDQDVLHLFPHWNWDTGKVVDVWAYYNNADEAELFLNGESLGTRRKAEGRYHVMWRVPFEPGILRVVKRKNGVSIQTREIRTAGDPAHLSLEADRSRIAADGRDLSFITVRVLDNDGNLCPLADNPVKFIVTGEGGIAGVDNGYQASPEPFKADQRKAFNGMCLLIVRSTAEGGRIHVEAVSDGLQPAELEITTK